MPLTYAQADAKVRETAHRFADTHLPHEKRWALAREHEANLADRADALRAIPYPDEEEAAWAEHAERQRIVSAYLGAHTKAEATAVRWEAYEYDLANPGTSPLVDELSNEVSREARADLDAFYAEAVDRGDKGRTRYIEALAADIDEHDTHGRPSLLDQIRSSHPTAA